MDSEIDTYVELCKKDNLDSFIKILSKGPKIIDRIPEMWITDYNSQTFSLSHICAAYGSINCLNYLFSNGIDPKQPNNENWNCLHFAARHGFLEIVKIIYESGIDINAQTSKGYTALILASWFDHFEVVQYLVENNADVSIQDNFHCTALYRAVEACNTDVASYLLDHGGDPNDHNSKGWLLHLTCSTGDVDTMRVLLEHHASVDVVLDNKPILYYAIQSFREDFVTLLVQYGADVNAQDQILNTPLHYACQPSQNKILKFLIEHGANVNAQNRLKETPLHKAAEIGSISIYKLLIEAGADPTIKDKIQRTPLDWARVLDNKALCDAFDENKKKKKPKNEIFSFMDKK